MPLTDSLPVNPELTVFRLDCLASKPLGTTCLSDTPLHLSLTFPMANFPFPVPRSLYPLHTPAYWGLKHLWSSQSFTWMLRIQTQVLCSHSEHFDPLSHPQPLNHFSVQQVHERFYYSNLLASLWSHTVLLKLAIQFIPVISSIN